MNNQDKITQITNNVREILHHLEITGEGTIDTPKRVAKMYVNEVFANVNNSNIQEELLDKMTYFPNSHPHLDEFVVVKDIPFFSMCEHHLMPFMGKITVGYIPNKRIVGLSKIPRVVKYFSKKPQLQERFVEEIADFLQDNLNCKAVFVLANNTMHTCVTARGIETMCSTDTLAIRESEWVDTSTLAEYKKDFYNRLGGRY